MTQTQENTKKFGVKIAGFLAAFTLAFAGLTATASPAQAYVPIEPFVQSCPHVGQHVVMFSETRGPGSVTHRWSGNSEPFATTGFHASFTGQQSISQGWVELGNRSAVIDRLLFQCHGA